MTSVNLDELYVALASDFIAENVAEYSFERLVELGRNLYGKFQDKIEEAVCSSEKVRQAYKAYKENGDEHSLLAAIADVILGLSLGLSPFLASQLVLKLGLEKLCCQRWEPRA